MIIPKKKSAVMEFNEAMAETVEEWPEESTAYAPGIKLSFEAETEK